MPAEVFWHTDDKIIGIHLFDTITLADIVEIPDKVLDLLDESDSPLIHVLTNQGDITHFPQDFQAIYRTIRVMDHPQLGWTVFYGADNKLSRFVAHMALELARVRHRHFDTLEESIDFLQSVDNVLADQLEKALS